MLSYTDFQEKQIVFLNAEWGIESRLSISNRNIVFKQNDEVKLKVNLHKIFIIFIVGDLGITTKLISTCREYGISIFFLKYNFATNAEIISQAEGNVVLRYNQYTDTESQELYKSKILVQNKIHNQLKLLAKAKQEFDYMELKQDLKNKINKVKNQTELMGIEGYYAKLYFQNYFEILKWWKRAPRTRVDIPNLLLDIGYTYLFNFVESLLRIYGFDTYKGFYHKLFFARKSLACDIMEPFRPIIDREIRKMYTLNKIDEKDFKKNQHMYELTWKNSKKYNQIFLEAILKHKAEIFDYIKQYYRYTMTPNENKFPEYKLIAK